MGDLTKNFSRREFACKCGCGFDDVSRELVEGLQQLRDLAGKPITVTSGCRCPKHNASPKVGGVKNSQHLTGKAADIVIAGMSPRKMAELAEQITAFQKGAIITYVKRGFIHVDVRGRKYREERIA